jgi:hypothetical protein
MIREKKWKGQEYNRTTQILYNKNVKTLWQNNKLYLKGKEKCNSMIGKMLR